MNTVALYARAIRASLRPSGSSDLPGSERVVRHVEPDLERLAAYARVCGFGVGDVLPPTYPHILAFPQSLEIQTDPRFPFPAIGTVHVTQQLTVHRPIAVTEPLSLRTFATDLRPHARGRQYDVVTIASVGRHEVWTGRSTYLHRSPGSAVRSDNSPTSGVRPAEPDKSAAPPEPTAVWRLGADLGRRYASVSGDRNPIHLYRASARLFGFKRQIVHGMWTFAACLAAMGGRLPDAYTVRADFKRPIYLPGQTDFSTIASEDGWHFAVHEHAGPRPHMRGHLSAL